MSSFQPEFESTQQFDTATQSLQLPNLRSSAQRFNYYNPPQPAMHIDSSFVRDSFPDFTEKSPSPSREPSMSIEAGRAHKGSPKAFDMSDIPLPSDSLYDLHSTPPRSTRPTPKKQESLRKEASLRRAHSTDKRANASQRRSLSDMHHKVRHESDSSFVGEDRPTTTSIQPRNTRFTSANLPTSYSHDQGLRSASTPQRPLQNPTADWTGTQTQASFMLPDLPNITELVSGVRRDGTPVFSRSQKSRSRFTSASYNNPTITNTIAHANIKSIAVPEEEKAIFASLQLLKDKVANLEAEKSEAQKRLEEYESEVGQLKSRLDVEQKLRRPDSALGEDDDSSAKEGWRVERATLKSTIKTLQDRLDRGERKLSVNDIAVKHLTKERDGLVTQLGVAYYNSEEFKNENIQLRDVNQDLEADVEALQAENGRLRVRLAQIKAQFNDETQQWNSRESDLKARIHRREAAARDTQHDLTMQSAPGQDQTSKSSKSRRSSGRLGQDTKHNILDSIENEIRISRSTAAPANLRSRSRSKSNTRHNITKPQRVVDVSDVDSTTNLNFTRTDRDEHADNDEDSKDITYLSFLDPRELARLRKTLEEERRASKTTRAVSAPQAQDNATSTNMTAVPRKSSMRDVANNDTGRFTIRSQMDENTGLLKNVRIQSPHTSDAISYSEPRESIEASFMSTSSRRRNRTKSIEEMTSAFILPDITLHTGPGAQATMANTIGDISHDNLNCTLSLSVNWMTQTPLFDPLNRHLWL
jgi:predicted nuclease with TOPRIM domain